MTVKRETRESPGDYASLRALLRARFPSGTKLGLDGFMNVEAALTLAQRVGGSGFDASRADRLLSNYTLLRPEKFGADEHLMQMARRRLFRLTSSTTWRKALRAYQDERLEPFRFFDFNDGIIAVRDRPYGACDRRPIYIEELLLPGTTTREPTFAPLEKPCEYWFKPEAQDGRPLAGRWREVVIPKIDRHREQLPHAYGHKGTREAINVSLDELIEVARQIEGSVGKAHFVEVLEHIKNDGLLKSVAGPGGTPTGALCINRVVNLVGLVGAGKSVLSTVLVVTLAKRGLRVISLMNSVSDVMENVALFRAVGIEATPLVSGNGRLGRLDELSSKGGPMLLDDSVARYLETPCLLDGLALNEGEPCAYGETPCRALRVARERNREHKDKKKDTGKALTCPYWDICPSQTMAREVPGSQVVVTTPSGFTTMSVGRNGKLLLELALEDFDLAIFDEADRVQAQLDDIFLSQMSFQDLIHAAADPTAAAMKRQPGEKMRDLDEEEFYDLRQSCEPVAKALIVSVHSKEVSSWKIVKGEAFTALSLYNNLTGRDTGEGQGPICDAGTGGGPGKELLPKRIADDLQAFFDGRDDVDEGLLHAMATSCQGVDSDMHRYALGAYLASRGCAGVGETLKQRLSFLLKVMQFDVYLEKLAASADFLSFKDDSLEGLYGFMRFRYNRQQRYLPSALVGNLCGMKLDDDNELTLFRQYAFGRALMTSLPWLDTEADGNPAGPHALLLSGSSWSPGCLQFHVNKPVDYVLEAARWKSEKLAGSKVVDLGISQYVSGSDSRQRGANLETVLLQLADTLRAELDAPGSGKALVIVNSYREAEEARGMLAERLGAREQVCALVRSPRADEGRFIARSEVHRFAVHPARILVAPAAAIERGHNIVDADGHATFTALVFAVRPMPAPGDLLERSRRLNGLIEAGIDSYPATAADFCMTVRQKAWEQWKCLERDERLAMKVWRLAGKKYLIRDRTATLLVLIVQVFGRLARIRDPLRPAPHVYFADAAFRGKDEGLSFRTLDEMAGYMEWLMGDSSQPQVAKALYGPFYEAFEKGICHA